MKYLYIKFTPFILKNIYNKKGFNVFIYFFYILNL